MFSCIAFRAALGAAKGVTFTHTFAPARNPANVFIAPPAPPLPPYTAAGAVCFFSIVLLGSTPAFVYRCKELSEYSAFIAKARSFLKELGNKEEAIKETVKYCQKHGILKQFLELYATSAI